MPSSSERKAAADRFKQQKPRRGVFVIRCSVTGESWVGASPNLDAARNGTFFMLRSGSHRDAGLQRDWNAVGEAAFSFDVLDELDDDVPDVGVADELRRRKQEIVARLSARALI